jgi:hypothetical protein
LGGWLSETGTHDADSRIRQNTTKGKIRQVARAWGKEGRFGRGEHCKIGRHVRLTIMKAVVHPTMLTFCRSRSWTARQERSMQSVANYALRRALGLDTYNMAEHALHDQDLRRAAGWETVTDMVMRQSLVWLGHVARMPIQRHPKVAMFGWVSGPPHDRRGLACCILVS